MWYVPGVLNVTVCVVFMPGRRGASTVVPEMRKEWSIAGFVSLFQTWKVTTSPTLTVIVVPGCQVEFSACRYTVRFSARAALEMNAADTNAPTKRRLHAFMDTPSARERRAVFQGSA